MKVRHVHETFTFQVVVVVVVVAAVIQQKVTRCARS